MAKKLDVKEKKAREQRLNFGKYKNKTLQQIYEFDPGYLVWLYETIAVLKISKTIYRDALEKTLAFTNDDDEDYPVGLDD